MTLRAMQRMMLRMMLCNLSFMSSLEKLSCPCCDCAAGGAAQHFAPCMAPQRERFDTHDLRRGFADLKTRSSSHGATARALRRAGSPQRVCQEQDTLARRHSKSASTGTISAEGLPSAIHIRAGATARALPRAQSPRKVSRARDTFAPQRRVAVLKKHLHGATARALRRAESPQRVRRAQDTFARDSASTRTISAEVSPSSRHICTAPQRERFDTHDLRRGFAELKTNSHGATARALPRAQSPQKVSRARDTFAPQRRVAVRHLHGATARALRRAESPQRVRRAQDTFARDSASTRTISAEGSPSSRHIRTAPQRESASTRTISAKGSPSSGHIRTAPQRESASTRTISAEGSPSSRHIRTAPQRGKTQIRRSARRNSESSVLKKGPFHAKLSHAKQLLRQLPWI